MFDKKSKGHATGQQRLKHRSQGIPVIAVATGAPVKRDTTLLLIVFLLLLILSYLVFTIVSMVPIAREHFFHLLLNPNLEWLLG